MGCRAIARVLIAEGFSAAELAVAMGWSDFVASAVLERRKNTRTWRERVARRERVLRDQKGITSVNEREPSTDERLAALRARYGQLYDPFRDRIDRDLRRCPGGVAPGDHRHRRSASNPGRRHSFCPVLAGFAPPFEEETPQVMP